MKSYNALNKMIMNQDSYNKKVQINIMSNQDKHNVKPLKKFFEHPGREKNMLRRI